MAPVLDMLASPPPLLNTAEAAAYLRFGSASGIRTLVARGELIPAGAGARCVHLFTVAELDRFIAARAARYARRHLGMPGDRKGPHHGEPRNEDALSRRVPDRGQGLLDPGEDHGPSHRAKAKPRATRDFSDLKRRSS